ncbi:phosphotransferase family protein [Naumannella halotolerans]|uniref:Phosphotransferase family enzyme n=1 Tax=Naumannella halotolerans TaxID=993414 RepID=A0A4R7J9X0_9ACTN|nr:aminoglycoside phosphotransferase family protein [Naumannella halotolerans]TDT34352.1 phosphotransferase family enzyme [Naumannella halotolerans]
MDQAAAWLLDRQRLAADLGAPAQATRLRHKPGLSTVAALELSGELRWIRVSTPGHADKLQRSIRTAEAHGATVVTGAICGTDLHWAHGPAASDPILLRAARPGSSAAGRQVIERWAGGGLPVLRYNPSRRMVARWAVGSTTRNDSDLLVRLNAAADPEALRVPAHLAAHGVRILVPTEVHRNGRISFWPWIDGPGDLAGCDDRQLLQQAGAELARLHRVAGGPGPHHGPDQLAEQRARQLRSLRLVDTELAEQAAEVETAVRLVERRHVRVHGDFSADQVLVDAGSRCVVADLDRSGFGDPRLDLAGFVAVELIDHGSSRRAEALLEGYGAAADDLRPWIGHALLTRLDQPFRAGDPEWRARTRKVIELAAGVLA